MRIVADLRDAIYHGAVKRVRPKAMTAAVIIGGLVPILWSHVRRRRRDETHRYAHDRRHRYFHDYGVGRFSGDLLSLAFATLVASAGAASCASARVIFKAVFCAANASPIRRW